ncbi:hypothetical protein ACLBW0_18120 [Enterobacteriaceae bacterium C34A]
MMLTIEKTKYPMTDEKVRRKLFWLLQRLSSYTLWLRKRDALHAGHHAQLLRKPFTRTQLAQALRQAQAGAGPGQASPRLVRR